MIQAKLGRTNEESEEMDLRDESRWLQGLFGSLHSREKLGISLVVQWQTPSSQRGGGGGVGGAGSIPWSETRLTCRN